jgi:hypothetical protein
MTGAHGQPTCPSLQRVITKGGYRGRARLGLVTSSDALSRGKGMPVLTCGWDGSAAELPEPGDDSLADLGAGIFLDEMDAGHGQPGLVRPGAAELPDRVGQDAARLGAAAATPARRRASAWPPFTPLSRLPDHIRLFWLVFGWTLALAWGKLGAWGRL